jgi:hypothetical protein
MNENRPRTGDPQKENPPSAEILPKKYSTETWAETIRRCESIVMKASGAACRVFVALKSSADSDGYCWPLVSTLAKLTGISGKKTLFRALKELEKLGVLKRAQLVSRTVGRNSPNLYRIGGRIENLPANATSYYGHFSTRRPRVKSLNTDTKRGEVVKSATSQTLGVRGEVVKMTPAEVVKMTPYEVVEMTTQNYSIELPYGTTPLEASLSSPVNHHHPHRNTGTDDDEATPEGFVQPSSADFDRLGKLKSIALAKFTKKNPEYSADLATRALNEIESRARASGTRIVNARYLEVALENEFSDLSQTIHPTTEESPSGISPTAKSDPGLDREVSFLADKLAKSEAIPIEDALQITARHQDGHGNWISWKKRDAFLRRLRPRSFPNTPEPRPTSEVAWIPETVFEILQLQDFAFPMTNETVLCRKVFRYLSGDGKFKSRDQRWKFEDHLVKTMRKKQAADIAETKNATIRERRRQRKAEQSAVADARKESARTRMSL